MQGVSQFSAKDWHVIFLFSYSRNRILYRILWRTIFVALGHFGWGYF